MDFVKSHFGKMNLWLVENFFEHICHHFWVGGLKVRKFQNENIKSSHRIAQNMNEKFEKLFGSRCTYERCQEMNEILTWVCSRSWNNLDFNSYFQNVRWWKKKISDPTRVGLWSFWSTTQNSGKFRAHFWSWTHQDWP